MWGGRGPCRGPGGLQRASPRGRLRGHGGLAVEGAGGGRGPSGGGASCAEALGVGTVAGQRTHLERRRGGEGPRTRLWSSVSCRACCEPARRSFPELNPGSDPFAVPIKLNVSCPRPAEADYLPRSRKTLKRIFRVTNVTQGCFMWEETAQDLHLEAASRPQPLSWSSVPRVFPAGDPDQGPRRRRAQPRAGRPLPRQSSPWLISFCSGRGRFAIITSKSAIWKTRLSGGLPAVSKGPTEPAALVLVHLARHPLIPFAQVTSCQSGPPLRPQPGARAALSRPVASLVSEAWGLHPGLCPQV